MSKLDCYDGRTCRFADEIEDLRDRLARAEAALQAYADPNNWGADRDSWAEDETVFLGGDPDPDMPGYKLRRQPPGWHLARQALGLEAPPGWEDVDP